GERGNAREGERQEGDDAVRGSGRATDERPADRRDERGKRSGRNRIRIPTERIRRTEQEIHDPDDEEMPCRGEHETPVSGGGENPVEAGGHVSVRYRPDGPVDGRDGDGDGDERER